MEELNNLDTEYKDNVVCPYCGHIQDTNYCYFDNEKSGTYECEMCGNLFHFKVITEISYSTYPIEEKVCPNGFSDISRVSVDDTDTEYSTSHEIGANRK